MPRGQTPQTRMFADLIKLSLAMKSFQDLGGEEKILKKGGQVLKRYKSDFESMINQMIVPLLEEGLAGLQEQPLLVNLRQALFPGQMYNFSPLHFFLMVHTNHTCEVFLPLHALLFV